MSDPAFGAAVTRLFDPENQTHIALPEDGLFELRELLASLDCIATLADTPPGAEAPEVEPRHLAPLFRTLARHGNRILAEQQTRFPRANRRAA